MMKTLIFALLSLNTAALAQSNNGWVLHGTKILDCHNKNYTYFLGVFEVTDFRTGKEYLELAATEWTENGPLVVNVTRTEGESSDTKEYFSHSENEYYLVVSNQKTSGEFAAKFYGEKIQKLMCRYVRFTNQLITPKE